MEASGSGRVDTIDIDEADSRNRRSGSTRQPQEGQNRGRRRRQPPRDGLSAKVKNHAEKIPNDDKSDIDGDVDVDTPPATFGVRPHERRQVAADDLRFEAAQINK